MRVLNVTCRQIQGRFSAQSAPYSLQTCLQHAARTGSHCGRHSCVYRRTTCVALRDKLHSNNVQSVALLQQHHRQTATAAGCCYSCCYDCKCCACMFCVPAHLGWLKRIVVREVNVQKENSTCVWRACVHAMQRGQVSSRTHSTGSPCPACSNNVHAVASSCSFIQRTKA
jgi:hypothetical protein